MRHADVVIADLARSRHGLFTTQLATAKGVTRAEIRSRSAGGVIAACFQGIPRVGTVWRLAAASRTDDQRVLAAVLACGRGAMAAGRTSLRLWDVELPGRLAHEVSVPRGRHPELAGVSVARPLVELDGRAVRRRNIPCSNPLRALIELGAVEAALVPDALEQVLADQRITLAAAHDLRRRHTRRGHAGVGVLADALAERALGDKPPDSVLEPAMAALVRAHALPAVEFHRRIGGFEVDFALPELRIVVEVDGLQTHGTPQAFEADRARDAVLAGLGWHVIRFTWLQVKRRRGWVARRLGEVIAERSTLLGLRLVV